MVDAAVRAIVSQQAPGNGLVHANRALYLRAEVKGRTAHDFRGLFTNHDITDLEDRPAQGIDNPVVAAHVVFLFPAGQLLIAYRLHVRVQGVIRFVIGRRYQHQAF